jgi:hypothetical protein
MAMTNDDDDFDVYKFRVFMIARERKLVSIQATRPLTREEQTELDGLRAQTSTGEYAEIDEVIEQENAFREALGYPSGIEQQIAEIENGSDPRKDGPPSPCKGGMPLLLRELMNGHTE